MKKKYLIILLLFLSVSAFSQDQIKVLPIDSLNNYAKNNDSILSKIDNIYFHLQKSLYAETTDTLPEQIMRVKSKIIAINDDFSAIEIDMNFSQIKESFLIILRAVIDFNNLHLSKTEEFYNKLRIAEKHNDNKEKENADTEICDFFKKFEEYKKPFIVNYKNEIENKKNLIISENKK